MYKMLAAIMLAVGIWLAAAGCGGGSLVHKTAIYADMGNAVIVLGSLDNSTIGTPLECSTDITAYDGPKVFRFTLATTVNAEVRVSVVAYPGARDISADLWAGSGMGYVAPLADWAADWTAYYQNIFTPGTYDLVVAPTNDTVGMVLVRAEILRIMPAE